MIKQKLVFGFLALLLGFVFYSCNQNPTEESAFLKVGLIDAPAAYDEVNIEVEDVLINFSDGDSGFVSIGNGEPAVYDLLELTGGVEALLADVEIPAGRIQQIRLILGDDNHLVVDGEEKELKVPSGSESGLKLKINAEVNPGDSAKITLDFDVDRSVVKQGNSGSYLLKPVIRAIFDAGVSGDIIGVVAPVVKSKVYAIEGSDTVRTMTNKDGEFLLKGLSPGTYRVDVVPNNDSLYMATVINDVVVFADSTTDVGTVSIANVAE